MKGIEVRFPVGPAWPYRPRGGDSQVPAVVLGTGLSYVRDQGFDRLLGALAQPATRRSRSTTGTSAAAVESPAARPVASGRNRDQSRCLAEHPQPPSAHRHAYRLFEIAVPTGYLCAT
jgi:hypothetical protein